TLRPSLPLYSLFFLPLRPPPRSTLFPYTTLFRSGVRRAAHLATADVRAGRRAHRRLPRPGRPRAPALGGRRGPDAAQLPQALGPDRKSTRLNSSHVAISYAVFCLKKKKKRHENES